MRSTDSNAARTPHAEVSCGSGQTCPLCDTWWLTGAMPRNCVRSRVDLTPVTRRREGAVSEVEASDTWLKRSRIDAIREALQYDV